MNINRRRFIKLSSLVSTGLPFIKLKDIDSWGNEHSIIPLRDELYESFRNPENIYRPFVRWWWNGDRLQEKEILRELDVMKVAGIGGVEINPIKFPSFTDDLHIQSLEWLSDEWITMLEVAVKGAKERDMYCDMIVGSGWPFGGEFLSREDQTQMAALGTMNLIGKKTLQIPRQQLLDDVNPKVHSGYGDGLKELMMVKLVPKELKDISESVDLTDQIKKNVITISVPDGEYVLYYLVKLTGYMAVINGAPGAGGPVLNHYSKPAVENYLNRMSEKLTKRLGALGNHFRAFFTDSLELEGANWCVDMFEQFKERKGYDLAPYFPFILFKVGEMGNAAEGYDGSKFGQELQQTINYVRYDFEDVRITLFKERFIDTFVSWCHKNGVKSRMQAYGRPCNPVEASMAIDIPECETWMRKSTGYEFSDKDYRIGRAYTMSNKFVSSGAHLAGKKEISCEEITNTDMVFNASLESIKISGDQSIISGVTHSVLHGFNYSPQDAPFPGWVRYGTFFNERNTWWPYFKKWADYKTRLYAILQQSEMQADIAILPPLADLSMRFGFQRDPFPVFAYPEYIYQIWEAIHQNGSGCDYVTENIIQQATIGDGKITYGLRSYKTLILIGVDSLLPSTAMNIKKFVNTGGKLICIEKVPSQSPTNQKAKKDDRLIIYDILKDTDPLKAGVVSAPKVDFVSWYKEIQNRFDIRPYVEIDNPDKFISQIYYRNGDKDIFFFSNYNSTKEHVLKTKFNLGKKNVWLWDPETGERFLYHSQDNKLEIYLGPGESRLLIFDMKRGGRKLKEPDITKRTYTAIEGPWKMTLKDINVKSTSETIDKLIDLSLRQDLKTFAGTVIYENTFVIANTQKVNYLQLGEIHGVAEITLNNQRVGIQWYGRPFHNISRMIKKGNNTIRIKLITTLGNHMKSLTENKVAQIWTSGQPLFPSGLIGPVTIL